MFVRLAEVKAEAVFEVTSGGEAQVVVLPFADSAEAKQLAPAVERLLTSDDARQRCRELRDAIDRYLAVDGGTTGPKWVTAAAAVIHAIEMLRIQTRQPVA